MEEQGLPQIEIVEGHNGGTCFRVMPVRIPDADTPVPEGAAEFYERLARRLELMMERSPAFSDISFMGP